MTLNDIKVTDQFELNHLEFYTKDYYKGYINGYLYDNAKDTDYEVLYRVYDPENGDENKLVSIDYGWECGENTFKLIEQTLTETANRLNLTEQLLQIGA